MDYNNNDFNNSNSNSTGNGYDSYRNDGNDWQHEPYQAPVNVPRDNMATASLVCGMLSIILCITGVFSLPMGALGIIFALLSKRKGIKFSLMSKIGYLFCKNAIKTLKNAIDPRNHNGAPLVGLKKISIKSHGNSDGIGFAHAISVAVQLAKAEFVKIEQMLSEIEKESSSENKNS